MAIRPRETRPGAGRAMGRGAGRLQAGRLDLKPRRVFATRVPMKRSRLRSLLPAWIALVAVLFSAVSPAIAAALLTDRPAALGRMLGLPAPAPECDEHAQHTNAGHEGHLAGDSPHEGAAHDAHGIYCSLCLNSSSTLTLPGVAPPTLIVGGVAGADFLHLTIAEASAPLLAYAARAPPPGFETA